MQRILLVEDDPVAQAFVKGILESRGWVVDTAEDGFVSLNMLREQSYAAALIDYHLPEMDGYALARLMRDICETRQRQLCLIAMTADRHGLANRRGVDRLFDGILAKPFAPTELIAAVDRLIPPARECSAPAKPTPHSAWPDSDQARRMSESFWRARGLAGLPKAHVVPTPSSDQADAIRLCFDIVDHASAELILIVDMLGFHDLIRSRATTAARLPVVTLDGALRMIADCHFAVVDAASWSNVAELVRRDAGTHLGRPPTIEASTTLHDKPNSSGFG